MARGTITTDQLSSDSLSGNGNAIVTFAGGPKPAGSLIVFDANGNAIAGTAATTHTELLTDGAGNIILANGDFIYCLGVPND